MKRLRLDKRAVVPRRVIDEDEFLKHLAKFEIKELEKDDKMRKIL